MANYSIRLLQQRTVKQLARIEIVCDEVPDGYFSVSVQQVVYFHHVNTRRTAKLEHTRAVLELAASVGFRK